MTLYTERFFSSNVTKNILTVLSVILLILALGLHFLYAAFNLTVKIFYDKLGYSDSGSDLYGAVFIPPFVYFVIAGIFQATVIIIYLLSLWSKIKPTLKKLAVLNFLLIALLCINFAIAVFTGIRWPDLKENFDFVLEQDEETSLYPLSDQERDFNNSIKNVYYTNIVECLVTFIIAIPMISLMIFLFLDRNFNKVDPKTNQEKEDKNANSASNLNK